MKKYLMSTLLIANSCFAISYEEINKQQKKSTKKPQFCYQTRLDLDRAFITYNVVEFNTILQNHHISKNDPQAKKDLQSIYNGLENLGKYESSDKKSIAAMKKALEIKFKAQYKEMPWSCLRTQE